MDIWLWIAGGLYIVIWVAIVWDMCHTHVEKDDNKNAPKDIK